MKLKLVLLLALTTIYSASMSQTNILPEWSFSVSSDRPDFNSFNATGMVRNEINGITVSGDFSGTTEISIPIGLDYRSSRGTQDGFIAKYDSINQLVWFRQISGDCEIKDITCTKSGYTLLLVEFQNHISISSTDKLELISSGPKKDGLILKYDPTGKLILSLHLACSDFIGLEQIAVDSSDNFIINGFYNDTLHFNPLQNNDDILVSSAISYGRFLAKYSSSGKNIWIQQPKNLYGINEIETDADNNIFITGVFRDTLQFRSQKLNTSVGNQDIFFVKLDTSGNAKWMKSVGSIGNTHFDSDIKIDSHNNIYVTGGSYGNISIDGTTLINSGSSDFFLFKYSNNGNKHWVKSFGGSGSEKAICLDITENGEPLVASEFSYGASFVSGSSSYTFNRPKPSCALLKFDTSGHILNAIETYGNSWIKAKDIVTLKSKIFFIGTFDDKVVVKNMAKDSAEDIGGSNDNTFMLSTSMHLDSTLVLSLYGKKYIYAGSASASNFLLDKKGEILSYGSYRANADFDPSDSNYFLTGNYQNGYIAKYDSLGAFKWAHKIAHTVSSSTTNDSGDIILAGYFWNTAVFNSDSPTVNTTSTNNVATTYFATYDSLFNFKWVNIIRKHGASGKGYNVGNKVKVDRNQNIYLSGFFRDDVDFDPGPSQAIVQSNGKQYQECHYISTYKQNGDFRWVRRINGYLTDFSIDSLNFIYVSVDFADSFLLDTTVINGSGKSTAIIKLDSSGTLVWYKVINNTQGNLASSQIEIDTENQLVLLGIFTETFDADPSSSADKMLTDKNESTAFLSSFDTSGTLNSANAVLSSTGFYSLKLLIDKKNKIHVSGSFYEGLKYGPSSFNLQTLSKGENDIFYSKFSNDSINTLEFIRKFIGLGSDVAAGVALRNNSIYLQGNFRNWIYLDYNGDTAIQKNGTMGAFFIAKFSDNVALSFDSLISCDSFSSHNQTVYNSQTIEQLIPDPKLVDDSLSITKITIYSTEYEHFLAGCDSVYNNNIWHYTSAVVRDTFSHTFSSCDSITINNIVVSHTVQKDTIINACSVFSLNGNNYTQSTTVIDTFFGQSSNGCDSILTYQIDILQPSKDTQVLHSCNQLFFNAKKYTTNTLVVDTFYTGAVNGCDSIVYTFVEISYSQVDTVLVSGCDSISVNGDTYLSDTSFSDTLNVKTSLGCDSSRFYIVSLTYTKRSSISQIACDSLSIGGFVFYQSAYYSDTFRLANCDSIISYSLTINPSKYQYVDSSITQGDSIFFNSHYYKTAGTYFDSLVATNGCDSIIELNLTTTTSNIRGNDELSKMIMVYPNPTSGRVNISLKSDQIEEVKIYDVLGKEYNFEITYEGARRAYFDAIHFKGTLLVAIKTSSSMLYKQVEVL
jgi:hypothetical protein